MDIGIDLGTTYSAVARLNKNREPELLKNQDGEEYTPSVLYFQENGDVIVGKTARDSALRFPSRVLTNAKNRIRTGESYTAPNGATYRPQDLSALIIKKLVQDAETITGEKVERAVITVPADYNDAQRSAIMEAAQLAGLKGRQLLDEPTAAAVAYTREGKLDDGKLLVYDLGGGTFDVSVIQQENGKSKVLATGGLHDVGGNAFDARIFDYVSDFLLQEYNIDVVADPDNAPAKEFLAQQVEKAKKNLSKAISADITLPFQNVAPLSLTRETYEQMILGFCQKTESEVKQVLARIGLTFSDLDRVLLVGGSSRTPLIQRRIEALCGRPLSRDTDPDAAVAKGACAANLNYIQDICSRSLGLITYDYAMDREGFSVLIPSNSPLPAKTTRAFGLIQSADHLILKLAQTAGDGRDMSALEGLRSYDISLPQALPPRTQVKLTLALENAQLLRGMVEIASPITFRQEFKLDLTPSPEERERLSKLALIANTPVI